MKIVWDEKALALVLQTAADIEEEKGMASGIKFMKEVIRATDMLQKFPNYGQKELLLRKSKIPFRRVVIGKLNKLIYFVEADTIQIVDFWDTRMQPATLVNRVMAK
jgi:plasmid stabilization system protein ParE